MAFRILTQATKAPRIAVQCIRRCNSDYTGPMEKCVNMVQLLGRVGQAPVVRGNEKKFVTFGMATTKSYATRDVHNQTVMKSKTEWHDVCVFKPFLAEKVEKNVEKGCRVMVIGSLEYNEYDDKDGKRMKYTRIVPDDVIILSAKKESQDYDGGFHNEN